MTNAIASGGPVAFLLTLLFHSGGCATYGDWVGEMEERIVRDDTRAALEVLDRHAADRDQVLTLMNRGMLLRLQGDLEASTAAFEEAKRLIESLLAVSISEQAGAFAVNDTRQSYIGEPFERVYLHVFAAFNYLDAGETGKARVEALQLDVLLGGIGSDPDFHGDAFARWLSGMIFEALGEYADAMIAYRKAREAYLRYPAGPLAVAVPHTLGRDLVRLGERLGLDDEIRRYRTEFGISDGPVAPGPGEGEVILLLGAGLAPVKREAGMAAPTAQGRLVSVSLPYYLSRRPLVVSATLGSGARTAEAELAEDIDALAIDALERRKPAIIARAVARALVKHEASRAAGRDNELVGFVVNIAGLASERADTRSWSTLPNRMLVARLALPAGAHEIDVELRDHAGRIDTRERYPIEVGAGEIRFLTLRRITPRDLVPLRPGEASRRP